MSSVRPTRRKAGDSRGLLQKAEVKRLALRARTSIMARELDSQPEAEDTAAVYPQLIASAYARCRSADLAWRTRGVPHSAHRLDDDLVWQEDQLVQT